MPSVILTRANRRKKLVKKLKTSFENLFNFYEAFRKVFKIHANPQENLETFGEFYRPFKRSEAQIRQTAAKFWNNKPPYLIKYNLKLDEITKRVDALEQRLLQEAGQTAGLNELW